MSRAPITLSREMKLGLVALLMLALLGGWLVMNNRRAADTVVTPEPVTTSSQNNTAGQAGNTAQGNAQSSGSTAQVPSAGTSTGNQASVVTAPPFPVTDPNGSTPDPTVPVPTPSGINPDTPLLSLNGHNPFRPVKLDAPDGTTDISGGLTGSTSTASASEPSVAPVTITQPTSTPSQINDALTSTPGRGAIPVAPLPGTSASTPGRTASTTNTAPTTSGGVIPITPLPGAKVPAPTLPGRTVSIPSSGKSPAKPAQGKANQNSTNTPAQEPAPIVPPIAGVREPSVNVPGAQGSADPGSTTPTGTAGNASTTNSASIPAPSAPQAITETQTPAPVAVTPKVNDADKYVQDHQVIFDAAVLGPVNTAILRSDKGFIVATVGQPLPDSKVVVKEVTATSVTLATGSDTTTLQLDKR